MSDLSLLSGPRIEQYRVDVLDADDNLVRTLTGVLSGRAEANLDAPIRGGLTLTLAEPVEWLRQRLRPMTRVNGVEWPLGVYLPQSPKAEYDDDGITWRVSCLDKTVVLHEHETDRTYSVAPGSVVTDVVRSLILLAGEDRISLTDSPKTTTALLAWTPGTSLLRIINDLLASINYGAIWCDRSGQYRVEPYLPPAQRPITATFAKGETAIHSPAFTRAQDDAAVPNKVVLISSGSGDEEALIALATNTDPASPYSFAARGNRWVTRTYEGVDAADQATLDALAVRYLWDNSTPVASLDVEHATVPLDLGDRIAFQHDDIDTTAVVNEWGVELAVGAWMTGLWNEVHGG